MIGFPTIELLIESLYGKEALSMPLVSDWSIRKQEYAVRTAAQTKTFRADMPAASYNVKGLHAQQPYKIY
ncbi:hypothetical protein BVRB_9g212900 isoform B [Beta vulgaris subsp. vulgaris]|nr:hypothetical protein BVRB_9g212900 isoform B [Beta vulgaris subsp. vulgaris]